MFSDLTDFSQKFQASEFANALFCPLPMSLCLSMNIPPGQHLDYDYVLSYHLRFLLEPSFCLSGGGTLCDPNYEYSLAKVIQILVTQTDFLQV